MEAVYVKLTAEVVSSMELHIPWAKIHMLTLERGPTLHICHRGEEATHLKTGPSCLIEVSCSGGLEKGKTFKVKFVEQRVDEINHPLNKFESIPTTVQITWTLEFTVTAGDVEETTEWFYRFTGERSSWRSPASRRRGKVGSKRARQKSFMLNGKPGSSGDGGEDEGDYST